MDGICIQLSPGWGCPGVKVPDPSRKLYRGTLRLRGHLGDLQVIGYSGIARDGSEARTVILNTVRPYRAGVTFSVIDTLIAQSYRNSER